MSLRSKSVVPLALVLLGCGASTEEPRTAPPPEASEIAAAAPGIALTIDLRGHRIDVAPDGALHAEGCDAARYDWDGRALIDAHGDPLFAASGSEGARSITAPDGTVVMTVSATDVMAGERALLHVDEAGMLSDAAPGSTPASTSQPIPEARREQVLSLLALVAMCWETHPRDIPEP